MSHLLQQGAPTDLSSRRGDALRFVVTFELSANTHIITTLRNGGGSYPVNLHFFFFAGVSKLFFLGEVG
jgi:hypothetical protein